MNEGNVYGILAAPPCTMFSLARTKANTPRDLKEGMDCVRACLDIIWSVMEIKQDTRKKTLPLKFWALENPNGMLKYFLGKPVFQYSPHEYGANYTKRTALWGWFNLPIRPLLISQLPPHRSIKDMMNPFKDKDKRKNFEDNMQLRSNCYYSFAKAFFAANQ